MATIDERLDNPVWYSLVETHKEFSIDYGNIKFYRPDYCPFGSYKTPMSTAQYVEEYSKLCDNFYLVGDKPLYPQSLKLNKELVCLQMVLDRKINASVSEELVQLNEKYSSQLISLVNLVQPGYFKSKTCDLGDYYGIFKDGTLVAVTGERMKMTGYTEISAVVTHPDHVGKGYAKQLISHVANRIRSAGATPYLHVAASNLMAIGLYEKLGFRTRRNITFWNLVIQ